MIGILGGTFDPFHLGHLHLANTVQKKTNLQSIKIIPCHQSPLRQQSPIASAKDRATMIKLAINEHPYLQLDERELNTPQPSYSLTTLESIRYEIGNHAPLCLIMGDDAFAQFTSWHNWKKILELAHLIVTTREKMLNTFSYSSKILTILQQHQTLLANNLALKPAGYIWLVDIKPLAISATKIRSLIKDGQDKDAQNFLSPKVWQYIKQHGLYR